MATGIPAVVFDLDGTLVDSSSDILKCIEQAFCVSGIPLRRELTSTLIGPPLPLTLMTIAPNLEECEMQRLIASFRELYASSGFPLTTIYDGIPELLSFLQDRRIQCLIATNKPRHLTTALLEKTGLRSSFTDFMCAGDEGITTKEELVAGLLAKWRINAPLSWMIGDTPGDISAGKKAGMRTIAHLGGYGMRRELLSCKLDHAVESMSEVCNVFRKVAGDGN